MSKTTLDFIFMFTVKPGQEERFEALTNAQIAVTKEKDPGVLIYNISRNETGEYCQFERYRDTKALFDHMETTKDLLEEWASLTEIREMILLGEPSIKLDALEGLPHRSFASVKGFDR